jgi:phosphatidate cytidylyltransferase
MLKQRILTALILIPIALGILFYLPPVYFRFVTAFLVLAGAWEWSNFMEIKTKSWRLVYCLLLAILCYASIFIFDFYLLSATFIWWLIAFIFILLYPRASDWWGKSKFIRGLMGVMVLVPCWAAINIIRAQEDGIYALLFLFILIWGADSAAYFVGRLWGKHKLAPQVSPGKSWQGFAGAMVFSILITFAAAWLSQTPTILWPWAMALSLTTVVFSVIGDLFESMLKRRVGLKDSSQLLPGHGGILDRIDSLTAAAPVFAFGGWLLGMYAP